MKNIMIRIASKSMRLINRFVNRKKIKRKVFCIGLHKTGTTSLSDLARKYGYKATHSTNWIFDPMKLEKFEFFCDGGSHFDGINEFDFEYLFYKYPDSLFILQTRDTKKWVISKLKHAGWDDKTLIEPNDKSKINHNDWRYKSLLTIEKFIEHKNNYEKKVVNFFNKNDHIRLLIIDITDRRNQLRELERLVRFLGMRSVTRVALKHKNRSKSGTKLSKRVLDFIDEKIIAYNTEIQEEEKSFSIK